MTSIRRVYIAVTVLLALAVMAVYACAAEPDLLPLILIQRQREAAGMTPHADPAPPIATGPSEPVAKAATSRPSAPPVVIKAADHVAQSSTKVAITPARKPPSGPHWTHPADLRAHLLSGGVHQHTAAELRGLSVRQMEAIHDADHNASRAVVRVQSKSSYCPSCSNPTRRLFGRWR